MNNKIILGIDEVGRGPWAGPLVVGTVILGLDSNSPDFWQDLTDSKKLSAKRRTELDELIRSHAAAFATGWVSATELDQIGLSAALQLATRRTVKQILTQKIPFDHIVIDGTINFLRGTPLENRVSTLKKADLLIKEVSAASIIAKVARDSYMAKIALQYPAYGFEKHVGYGTTLHKKALLEHGICPEHRQSFRPIREIITKTPEIATRRPKSVSETLKRPSRTAPVSYTTRTPSHTIKGKTAEQEAASYLKTQNHQIIAQNFRTKTYEIDLISIKDSTIFFTEVKYSENPQLETTALVRITPAKQHQMRFAANCFLANHPEFNTLEPRLAVAAVHGTDYHLETWFTLD